MASPRVAYLGGAVSRFGDIHQALGYRWTAEGRETLYLRSKVLIDAQRRPGSATRSAACGAVTATTSSGLRAWAEQLRDLGYYGMMLGDPVHLPLVHEVFTPSAAEVAYWTDLDRLAADGGGGGDGPDHLRRPEPGRGPRRAHRARRIGPPEPGLGPGVGRRAGRLTGRVVVPR